MASSKLALVALPLVALLAFGCAAPSEDAGAESATDALTSTPASELAAFDALKAPEKVDALFDHGALRPGFVETPIRIVETVPAGPDRQAALDAYYTLRDYSLSAGGNVPAVDAIAKDGVTYAYSMQARGSYHSGSWGEYVVYDRTFVELTRSSYSE